MIKKNINHLHEKDVMSDALNSVFEDLESSKHCVISEYNRKLRSVPANVRHYYMCDIFTGLSFKCLNNDVLFSFVPESKLKKTDSNESEDVSCNVLRQYGSPSKLVRTFVNDKRPTEKVPCVTIPVKIVNNDMSVEYKDKPFWYDEEFGVAYNDAENIFELANETNIKDVKLLKKQFTLFKTDDFENFANYVKNSFLCSFEFKVIRGNDIAHYYHYRTYFDDNGHRGSLWGSCMRDRHPNLFKYYTENPETIGLLVAMYDGKILGRALLWNSTKGLVMDRIYSYEDYILQAFLDYAVENKITYKERYTSAGSEDRWMVYNESKKKHEKVIGYRIEIPIKKNFLCYGEEHPYKDTFFCTTEDKHEKLNDYYILTNYRFRDNRDRWSTGREFPWGINTPEVLQ